MNASEYCVSNTSDYKGIYLDGIRIQLCYDLVYVRTVSYIPIVSVMNILCFITLLITISGKIKEDYKYFIFNSAALNLSFGVFMEIYAIFVHEALDMNDTVTNIFYQYRVCRKIGILFSHGDIF